MKTYIVKKYIPKPPYYTIIGEYDSFSKALYNLVEEVNENGTEEEKEFFNNLITHSYYETIIIGGILLHSNYKIFKQSIDKPSQKWYNKIMDNIQFSLINATIMFNVIWDKIFKGVL